jgi:hypothetical protein
MNNTKGWLQDCDWNNKIGRKNNVVLPVNSESMRIEILGQNVGGPGNIQNVWKLPDDIEIIICLHQSTWRSSHCGTHICDKESTLNS